MLLISRVTLLLSLFHTTKHSVSAYFGHELYPQSFNQGEEVKLKVNKLTSVHNVLPIEYYSLPFCQPEGGGKVDSLNLGQLLVNDRIESSPYVLRMKQDMYCEQLCSVQIGGSDEGDLLRTRLHQVIREQYHNNWILDNLNPASKIENEYMISTRYWQGIPIGFTDVSSQKVYIFNHVNIEIMYSPIDSEPGKYHIVRYIIQPFSIAHEYDPEENGGTKYTIKNPILSCKKESTNHTIFDMVYNKQQEASGNVLFTYDVVWIKNNHIQWTSRWDIYLSMDNAIPDMVHWYSIVNSAVVVCILVIILLCFLRRDIIRYNRAVTDQVPLSEGVNEYGWKLVHADVFRPPSFSPLWLAVLSGTGAQLLCTSNFTIVLAASGFLHPSRRGHMLIIELVLFALLGIVNGYTTARLYKSFYGRARVQATILTAVTMPGFALAVFFVSNMVAATNASTYAVPLYPILVLVFLWLGITTPLVFLGAYIGYKQDIISFPVPASSIPRAIPSQPRYLSFPVTLAAGGILSFGALYVELYYIMSALWMGYYYYEFGFLFIVLFVLFLTCAEITVLIMYFQLNREDHRWWWRSFCNAGSIGIYVFFYSFFYFNVLEASNYETYVIYFGYMGLVSFALFCMMGFVGLCASLWFNKKIFTAIKID